MLRFFEPEADSWWPAATPSLPPHHFAVAVDPRLQGGAGPSMPAALATVDLVKGRWFPALAPASNGSQSSSPNSSSSAESMISYGMSISWQGRTANLSSEPPSDSSFALFQGYNNLMRKNDTGERSSSTAEAMMDWTKRRVTDEGGSINLEVAVRESKKQRTCEEKQLHNYSIPSFQSTSSTSTMMMTTTQQTLKLGSVQSKSKKMGDKITALQQLVSPFGKTDTASVLHEAAVYIKAHQEQIKLLANPYLESISVAKAAQVRNGGDYQHQKKKSMSMREVGLCIVPISPVIVSLVDQEQLDSFVGEGLSW